MQLHTSGESEIQKNVEKIIRDADLTQILSEGWFESVIVGLSTEFGISRLDFLKQQVDYLSALSFQSKWGQEKLQPLIPGRIENIKEYLNVLAW